MCVVQALHGGPVVMECRERILARLAAVLDEGRREGSRGGECTLVTAEGLVGGAFGVIYARLRSGDRRPLTGLLDELMGMIALQYLGARAARREQAAPCAGAWSRRRVVRGSVNARGWRRDPLGELPMRLTYRTALVLSASPSVRWRATVWSPSSAGVADPGQISKLLRRLERLGLAVNTGGGHQSGEPNAWKLTALGYEVERRLSVAALSWEETGNGSR